MIPHALRDFLCRLLGHAYDITVIEDNWATHDVCERCGRETNRGFYALLKRLQQ